MKEFVATSDVLEMKNPCRILAHQLGTVKLAVILFFLVGTLILVTMQFDRVPKEVHFSIDKKTGVYPTQECEAEWFPARHWARPSPKYSDATTESERGQQMYGTVAAQHAIWMHQHPSSCHDKKFLVYEALGRDHGIGSVVHVLSIALQAALNMDRILLLAPQPQFEWVQGHYCEGMETLDECYFEPLSSCTILDALGDAQELNIETYTNNSARVLRSAVMPMGSNLLPFLMNDTPLMFHSLLKSGSVSSKFYYWWRAQSSAYLIRPTLRTVRELDRRRESVFRGQRIEPGTISVHVRHGDKWKENKLEDDSTFFRKAEALVAAQQQVLQRRVFLSTEDHQTVRFFGQQRNWTVQYTEVKREADPNTGPEDFAAKIGWDEEFLNSLLSLQLALDCDGFVGAMTSNWNRLIDELRSTVRCRHHRVFVDVVQGFHISEYGW